MGQYDNNEQVVEQDEDESFDSILGIKEVDGEQKKTARQDKDLDPTKDIKLLKKQLADRDSKISELANEVKALRPAAETVQKLQRAIVGDPEGQQAVAEKEILTRKFDQDPVGTFNELLNKRDQRILDSIQQKERKRSVQDVMKEVENEYSVDWDKYGKHISDALGKFSSEYKENNLKAAVISAIEMTRAGTKRKTLPFMEGSNLSPELREKQRLTEEQEVKRAILRHRDHDQPLRGMYEALSK